MRGSNPSKRNQKQANKPYISQLSNMVTIQEQHMMDLDISQSNTRNKVSTSFINQSYNEDQQQQQVQYSIEQLKKSNSDRISTLISQLLAKNINAKNAFEVPLIHLNETNAYQQSSSDNSWKKLSSALESNNRIYGYRVDATHNYTYRVLQSITRQEKKNQDKVKDETKVEKYEMNSLNTKFVCNQAQQIYGKYLEKNYRNINIIHLETFFNVNPVLEKTKRIFDQQGLKGLLLNNLDIKQNLSLRITFSYKGDEYPPQNNQNQLCEIDENIFSINFQVRNIFKNIEIFCKRNNIVENNNTGIVKREVSQLDQLWNIYQDQIFKCKKLKQHQRHKMQIEFQESIKSQNPFEGINREQVQMPFQLENSNQIKPQMPMINISRPIQLLKEPESSHTEINQQKQFLKNGLSSKQQESQNDCESRITQSGKIQEPLQRFNIIKALKLEEVQPPSISSYQEQQSKQKDTSVPIKILQSLLQNQRILQNQRTYSNHSNQNSYQNSSNNFTLQKTQQQQRYEIPLNLFEIPNKLSLSTDLILRQINDYQGEIIEKVDLVSQWKKSSRVTEKKPRIIKQVIPPPPINFLDMDDGVCIKKKNLIMNLDKSRKMELKRLLKQINLKPYSDFNYVINTSKWKLRLDEKTFLREYYDENSKSVIIISRQLSQNISHSLRDNSIVQIIVDQKEHPNFTKNCSIKQSKQKIRHIIMEKESDEVSFEDIYNIFLEREGSISPALCFLTMLHLTNEYNYELMQREGEYNFTLIKNI